MTTRFYSTLLLLIFGFSLQAQEDLADYVNTLQGTNSKHELTRGNTYPTTALPFGMNTWTPQTGNNGDGWKYQYFKKTIRGFQQAHQCSSWSNDYAVFSLMPSTGTLKLNENERQSGFSHDNETAKPHYYQVALENGVNTEMAPTERGVHMRFSYPKKEKAFLVLDGYTGLSNIEIDEKNKRITGYVHNGRGMDRFDHFKNYFIIQFDKSFKAFGTWDNTNGKKQENNNIAKGKGKGAYIQFKDGTNVQAKIASSYISIKQAEVTLKNELGNDKKLEDTKSSALKIWNTHLSKIKVEGGSETDFKTFYSCFFRASLFSRKFYEINEAGEPYYFSPYDGKVHDGYMYTDTGFWDTFRAQFPLNALLYPEMHGRYVSALLDAYDQCGWLPSWSFPSEAGSMIGNHAISLLADAWAKGIHTFDPEKALKAYYHEATEKGPWGPANGRHGYKEYYTLGYVPYPKYGEATAKTLEYAYDDFCAYNLAKMTGNTFYQNIFGRQMYNYKNVYDEKVGFMRGRKKDGSWVPDFDSYEWGGPFTEGNAWHYLWSVFQDPKGLINLMGGEERFNTKMDSVFSVPNTVHVGTYGGKIHEMTEMEMADMGQYAHGNQPIQHMIYLYNYSGQPWKAQHHVREVMSKLYSYTENGYPGDEDQGQTSSWYVLSAMGFYSVCPGTDEYILGSPLFEKTTITLENGKEFVISAKNNSEKNIFINNANLNSDNFTKNYLTYSQIIAGGSFNLEMTDTPNKTRGLKETDKPFSLTEN
ncbi:GH92 family glycosyl hydrolase [Leeuwenhoekiella marinoflava]|uniref:Alpha-1,2-mannosidase, putative n=2 Tax=Leeuwenhoekiella marinoflava TaxID=988 RepID=A0ABY1HYS1_9FLAO|nr:GH92 family glycosyl hydrolase [Leeuwenhoekiella marinoflava]RXG25890.1 putative alpha-1,2-mannosidase [Leeuwenhoekiella marinoflava]SHF99821.1 alpha-1,2-mannosidase, putative [Leeuwenhoekiella marinoflava DSM 3653]